MNAFQRQSNPAAVWQSRCRSVTFSAVIPLSSLYNRHRRVTAFSFSHSAYNGFSYSFFSPKLGIDLGTTTVLVFVPKRGIAA